MNNAVKATFVVVIVNIILFIAKFSVGIATGSISVLSDALNSFIDIFSSVIVYIAIKVANKRPDSDHHFGHHRAEPLAALLVAILTGVLGFEIAKESVIRLMSGTHESMGIIAILVLVVNIIIKYFIWKYFIKNGIRLNRPAFKATGIDARNDMLVSFIALIGVFGAFIGYLPLDEIAALAISGFILYFGYKFAIENIDYLMGKSPPQEYIAKIKAVASRLKGVKGINDLRAHYVGNRIHVEIHIEVDKKISTKTSHDIGKHVQIELEKIQDLDKAFVHIDPV